MRSRGGTQMQPKEVLTHINQAATRAVTQHQRRNILNKKYQRVRNAVDESVMTSKIAKNP